MGLLAHLGNIGVLTRLSSRTTLDGIVAADWDMVETGPIEVNAAQGIEELQNIYMKVIRRLRRLSYKISMVGDRVQLFLELEIFSWASRISSSVVSHEIHSSVTETP